jgi:two-component system cell cycle sensor histidine kinase PleC
VLAIQNANLFTEVEEKGRQLELASQHKSQFVASMSHELRTPLNAIIGFSEVMVQQMFGAIGAPKYVEYARDIHRSGQYLLDVISDILDMSKIEAGKVQLEVRRHNLLALVEECLRIVNPRAQEGNVEVAQSVPSGLTIEADKRALKQVLINLIANAIKFTPERGKVSISASRRGDHAALAISDTGIGIPAQDLAKLGRPFAQVENQFTKTRSGSGLGLAISKSLIEMHGGSLRIESAPNRGTTVTVVLPSAATEAAS